MSMWTCHFYSAWPYPSPWVRSAIRYQNPRHPHHPLTGVLLHGSPVVGGLDRQTNPPGRSHQLSAFPNTNGYGLNQLRYDLRKLKGHGLLERDGSRYAYRLTAKGVEVALLFLLFHKRLRGPLANSRFHHRPDPQHRPASRLEAAYHRADKAIERIVDLLAAA
jgi:hypothetical protein